MADKSVLHHALPIFLAGVCNLAFFFASTCRAADLYVGSNASGVTTNFTSGTNSYDNTYVGFTATDSNNTLNVLNVGTLLANTSGIYVGYDGSGNSLVISNGGHGGEC